MQKVMVEAAAVCQERKVGVEREWGKLCSGPWPTREKA